MACLKGKGIVGKIVTGKIFVYHRQKNTSTYIGTLNEEKELKRFERAREAVIEQLDMEYKDAMDRVGKETAKIFVAHKMILSDKELIENVNQRIHQNQMYAETAIESIIHHYKEALEKIDDDYIQARCADIEDVLNRLLFVLYGRKEDGLLQILRETKTSMDDEALILVTDTLTPAELLQLNINRIAACVLRDCSIYSHTAILARTMNMPMLLGIEFEELWHDHLAIADCESGRLYIDPSQDETEEVQASIREVKEQQENLNILRGKATETKSGKKLRLCANASSLKDVTEALQGDAEGIGLFRSEEIFLSALECPTEEVQFQIYKKVMEKMQKRPVTVRTLDIGADKQAACFLIEKEENPAMGYRGIRVCLTERGLFKTQLRALLRAGIYGDLAIMFPMIISVDEVRACKEILAEAKKELSEEGVDYKEEIPVGVMIETPAAVWISDELAQEVSFFGIGTNDLTQYMLAIDRQNPNVEQFYNPYHLSVQRAIREVVKNGHKHGIQVGICGELAADLKLTQEWVSMGIDELSVPASMILKVREKIRSLA